MRKVINLVNEAKDESISEVLDRWEKEDSAAYGLWEYLDTNSDLTFVSDSKDDYDEYGIKSLGVSGYYYYLCCAEANVTNKTCIVGITKDKKNIEVFIWDFYKKKKESVEVVKSLDEILSLSKKYFKSISSNSKSVENFVLKTLKSLKGVKVLKDSMYTPYEWGDSIPEIIGTEHALKYALGVDSSVADGVVKGETYTLAKDIFWCNEEEADADYAEYEEDSRYFDALMCRKFLELDAEKGSDGEPWIVLPKGTEITVVYVGDDGLRFSAEGLPETCFLRSREIRDKSGKKMDLNTVLGISGSSEPSSLSCDAVVDGLSKSLQVVSKKEKDKGYYLVAKYNSGELHFYVYSTRNNDVIVACVVKGV